MLYFLVSFSLKISETLKAHISGTEADINNYYMIEPKIKVLRSLNNSS